MKRDLSRLHHRRTLRFLIWVVAAAAIVLLPGSGFASAQDERLTFLDEDPVEFNLDQPPGASQTVEVVNGDTKPLGSLRLQVIGLPADVVAVEPPKRTGVKPGATARFALTRKGEATSGKGRLVAVGSNGAVARRPVVLASQNNPRGDDLDDVVLRAWRLWPWRDQFEVDAVVVEGAGAIPGNSPIAFVSTEGDVARVTI